jgi:hypothetical protein
MKLNARCWSILATGVLALSLVGTPAMAASPSSTDPVETVNAVLDTIVAKDFASLPSLVCDQYRADVAQTMDFTTQISAQLSSLGADVDPSAFVDGLTVTIEGRNVTLESNDGTNAVVKLEGQLVIGVDEAAAKELVGQLLVAAGQEPTPEMVDVITPTLVSQISAPRDLTKDVKVIMENGAWLVCEPLDASPAPAGEPAASPAGSPAA